MQRFVKNSLALLILFAACVLTGSMASADVLNINSVGKVSGKYSKQDRPSRGMSKTQVEKTYGAPIKKMDPVGKNPKRKMHHAISRWVYKDFTVVFAEDNVVDTISRR